MNTQAKERKRAPRTKAKDSKHNYTSEMELKSLLIREKNHKDNIGLEDHNAELAEMIREFEIRPTHELKDKIIKLSEVTQIDAEGHNRFGEIILLMLKKILTKPNFSGYTWKDEFYSDGCYTVLKYLHNFDHNKISPISGYEISAFAYISQILHNSIISIINTKDKAAKELKRMMGEMKQNYDAEMLIDLSSTYEVNPDKFTKTIELDSTDFIDIINTIKSLDDKVNHVYNIIIPQELKISMDNYSLIREAMAGTKAIFNISRAKIKRTKA